MKSSQECKLKFSSAWRVQDYRFYHPRQLPFIFIPPYFFTEDYYPMQKTRGKILHSMYFPQTSFFPTLSIMFALFESSHYRDCFFYKRKIAHSLPAGHNTSKKIDKTTAQKRIPLRNLLGLKRKIKEFLVSKFRIFHRLTEMEWEKTERGINL